MSWQTQPRDRRGRWTKRSGFLVALLVFGLAAVGVSSTGLTGLAGAGGDAAAGRSATAGQDRGTSSGRTTSSRTRARARDRTTARVVRRLRARGVQVDDRGSAADLDCAAHSYGRVHEFFGQHPCTALFRALLEVHGGRAAVLIAVAWVDMPDEAQADTLKRLVDRSGSGNLTELTKEGRAPTSTRWTGDHYASARDETTVVNAQAEPIGSLAAAAHLAELARAAVG